VSIRTASTSAQTRNAFNPRVVAVRAQVAVGRREPAVTTLLDEGKRSRQPNTKHRGFRRRRRPRPPRPCRLVYHPRQEPHDVGERRGRAAVSRMIDVEGFVRARVRREVSTHIGKDVSGVP